MRKVGPGLFMGALVAVVLLGALALVGLYILACANMPTGCH